MNIPILVVSIRGHRKANFAHRFPTLIPHVRTMSGFNGENLSSRTQRLTRGQIGCHISHRRFLEYIVEKQFKSAIIFEDDVTFNCRPREVLSKLHEICVEAKNLKDIEVDMLLLGRNARKIKDKRRINDKFAISHEHWGQFAYFVTAEAAKKILELLPVDPVLPYDVAISNMAKNNQLVVLATDLCSYNKTFVSDTRNIK